MTGKVHFQSGKIISIGTSILTYIGTEKVSMSLVAGFSCLIGSVFADIDSSSAKVGRPFRILLKHYQSTQDHRKHITHTPFFIFISMFLLHLLFFRYNWSKEIYVSIAFGFSTGYINHLLLDSGTKGGIRWLFPLSNSYISFRGKKCGHKRDKYIAIIFTGIHIMGLIFLQYKYNLMQYIY